MDAHRVIDARGCLLTPGFVDIHTHYDVVTFEHGEATGALPGRLLRGGRASA